MHCKKTSNYVLLPSALITWCDKTLSCLPGAPASMLQEKNKHKQTKTKARQEEHRRKYKQPVTPRPHNVAKNSRISSFVFLSGRAREPSSFSLPPFVSSGADMVPPQDPQLVSFCARQLRRRTCCRCASFRGRQTCCRNYRGAARHILPDRRGHEELAAFCLVDGTVHRPHKAWCASALRGAPRVCSSTCTLVSVLRLSAVYLSVCVSNLHYCGAPRCLTCTIAGSASIVQVLHYRGRCLCAQFLPALYRAPALFNLHHRGSSTEGNTRPVNCINGGQLDQADLFRQSFRERV